MALPVLARIGGLPADAVDGFATGLPRHAGSGSARAADRLARCRAAAVDRLHAAVPGAPPELRRFLLQVKRDCHNGRPLAPHRASPLWAALRERTGNAADRVAALEARRARRANAFHTAYRAERDRQRGRLLAHLADREFARGLALASPDLLHALRRLERTPADAYGRREERAQEALLRYVSRAALKLSPFSTFTPVGLGVLRGDAGPGGVRLVGPWRARSLVRVKLYLVHQLAALLRRHAPARELLPVRLNGSLEAVDGSALLLRPGHWTYEQERWGFLPDALVRVDPGAPLTARAAALLAGGPRPLGELAAALEAEAGAGWKADEVRPALGRLLRAGFLLPALPWPALDGHAERTLARRLPALAPDPAAAPLRAAVERLVALEASCAAARDPAVAVAGVDRAVERAWEAAAALGGLPPGTRYDRPADDQVNEDVFLVPARPEGGVPAVLHLSRAAAEEALRSAAPLLALTTLFDHRHELRHELAALARERWPGRGSVGVLELSAAAQPLWHAYTRFRREHRRGEGWLGTWNPRGVPELAALAAHRAEVLAGVRAALVSEGEDVVRLPVEALRALLDRVPARRVAPLAPPALFLQPASADGTLWVLNRLREGTGRYASRFTPAMPPGVRRRWCAHLAARGEWEVDGEPAALLDVVGVQGDTLNVHAPQTPAVLALPGMEDGVPPGALVRLADLRVTFDGPGGEPRLRGRDGRRWLPVHLGLAYDDCMPPIVRFLCTFGPSEPTPVYPPYTRRREGDATIVSRTLLGNLVLHRKMWTVHAAPLAAALAGRDEAGAFAALQRWRAERGIPGRVFLSERHVLPVVGDVYRPQYVDFTSPLFASLFRAAVEGEERITLTEALPGPELFPRDADGRARAVEVLLDSLALQRPRPGARLRRRAAAGRPAPTTAGG